MACELNLEYCTRSCGCANCIYNTANRGPVYISPEQEARNRELAQKHKNARALRHRKFIEKTLPKVVVPLIGDTDGNGFFIKNHFVTAAHCLENGPIQIFYEGEIYTFKKEDAVIFETIDKSSDEIQRGDIAIFKFEKPKIYLQIGPQLNSIDTLYTKLLLAYYKHISLKGDSDSIFSYNDKYELQTEKFSFSDSILIKSETGSNSYYSYMFEANTDASIREGCSGSPLLNEEHQVVGLLIGCRRPESHPNLILFQHMQTFEYQLNLFCLDSDSAFDDTDYPF